MSLLIQYLKKTVLINKLKYVEHKNTKKERVKDIPRHPNESNWRNSIPEDKIVLAIMKYTLLYISIERNY